MNNSYEKFMRIAIEKAAQSGVDVPVGAVLVYENQIIAAAANTKELSGNPLNHAEKVVIEKGIEKIGDFRGKRVQLYVTLEPCPMCAAAIIYSRIEEVYFGAYDSLYGAFGSVINMEKIMNSKIKIVGGLLEEDSSNLLRDYFRKIRDEKDRKS